MTTGDTRIRRGGGGRGARQGARGRGRAAGGGAAGAAAGVRCMGGGVLGWQGGRGGEIALTGWVEASTRVHTPHRTPAFPSLLSQACCRTCAWPPVAHAVLLARLVAGPNGPSRLSALGLRSGGGPCIHGHGGSGKLRVGHALECGVHAPRVVRRIALRKQPGVATHCQRGGGRGIETGRVGAVGGRSYRSEGHGVDPRH